MISSDPKERAVTAGEFFLGTLEAEELHEVQRELSRDPAFVGEISFWEEKFEPLLETLPAVSPPHRVWNGIERALDAAGATQSLAGSFLNSVRFWRPLALVATAVALALFFFYRTPIATVPFSTPRMGMLGEAGQAPTYLLALDPRNRVMTVQALNPVALPPQKSLELWMLPSQGKAPVSCGIIPAQGRAQMILPEPMMGILLRSEGLAVTMEPEGGAPGGKPTGSIIYQGQLLPI